MSNSGILKMVFAPGRERTGAKKFFFTAQCLKISIRRCVFFFGAGKFFWGRQIASMPQCVSKFTDINSIHLIYDELSATIFWLFRHGLRLRFGCSH